MSLQIISVIIPLLVAGALAVFYRKTPIERNVSVSRSVASRRSTYITAALFLTVIGPIYYGFILGWLAPRYNLHPIVTVIGIVGFFGQTVALWVPAVEGWRIRIHTIGALLVGLAMTTIGLALFIAASSLALRIVGASFLAITLAVVVYAMATKYQRHALTAEVVFAAAFYVLIITATYLA